MAEIEQRIESRLSQRFKAQFEQLKAQMFENMDSRGLEAYRQVTRLCCIYFVPFDIS